MRFKCIGCGKLRAKKRWTYCRKCRYRVRNGITCDIEDVPTEQECRRWCAIDLVPRTV